MSERKRNLGIAWSVWIETVTQALTRAREDRLGCRIDVPARGGDAVCELLDGAEVIGRYVAMGVQVGLPLGEAKAEPSRGRVRYGFRPADLAVLTDDELARLDDLFPGGFVQARLPRTDPAVWWHTRSTEPSEATAAFLVWTISRLPGGVPVANDDPDDQRRIDAAREVAFAPSTTNLVNLFRWPSAPTGFQHATAETPQEPAPVETATSGGYQAVADAASRAPVGDPTSALGELLAAAEGTLIPHAQGPVTVRSLRPVADLRAEEQAPAITEELKRKLEAPDAPDCAVCHTAAPSELKVGVTVFVHFAGARFPEAYTVSALPDGAVLLDAPDATQPGGRALQPTLRVPRESVRWTASEEGDGGRWELPVVTLRDDGGPTHYRYGLLASTLAGLSAEALDELDRIHPTGYVWVDLNGKGSPAWWMNAAHDAPVAKALHAFGARHKVSYLTRQDTAKDRARLATLPAVELSEAAATSVEMARATSPQSKATKKPTAKKSKPEKPVKAFRFAWTSAQLAKFSGSDLDALEKLLGGAPVAVVWADPHKRAKAAWWTVNPLADGSALRKLIEWVQRRKCIPSTRLDRPGDAEAFAPLERITLRDAATQAREAREATKPATTKGRDAKPENVSEKAPKGDVVRVIVTPTDEALGGFKGFRWLDVTRGLHGWNAMKTPTAGGLSGGTCRPLELHVAPPGPDVKTLIERLTKKKVPFLDFGNVPRAKEFDFAPSRRPIREKWNAAHPNHPVVLDGPLGAHGPTWEKPARTKRPNLATPPPEADAQRAEEFASIVQEGFVRPVIAREAWEKLTDEARGAFAVFRLGSGSHVRTSWGPTKDGKGVEPLLPPIGRRSEIALNLEEIAAELGVTLTFEPHPVMGIPAPDAPSSSGAPDDAPAAPAKLHRQTPEPAADKRAGRGRHTILAQDASGAWTFKRERHGELAPAWTEIARELAASGKRVRVYDGKPRCTWDSLDEPVPQFEQPAPEPAQAPASPEPGNDATPAQASPGARHDAPAPGTVRVWIAEDQWEALHPDDRTAFEHPDIDVEPVWEGGYQHVATTVDARGLAALQGLITARELDVTLREDAAPVAPAEVTLYLAAATWEGMDEAMRAEFGNAAGRAYAAYRDGVSPWRTFGPMPRASADRMLAKGRELALRLYDVEPGTGTAYRDAAHAFDARVTGKGAGVAITDQNHGTRFLGRKSKQTDAEWTREVGEILSGSSGLEVMRLYDRKGRCTWDSRDGGPVTLGGPAATGAPAVTLADRNLRVLWRANHHPTDTVVATSYPNRAALAIETETGTQYVERPPKLSEATWKQKARDTIAATAGVKVARLYSQKAKCLWDSRDGKAIG